MGRIGFIRRRADGGGSWIDRVEDGRWEKIATAMRMDGGVDCRAREGGG